MEKYWLWLIGPQKSSSSETNQIAPHCHVIKLLAISLANRVATDRNRNNSDNTVLRTASQYLFVARVKT